MRVDADRSKWLQSNQQVALFDNLFVRCNPSYLSQASPLVILSVGAAVTAALQTNTMERLTWLETVFHAVNPRVITFPTQAMAHV